MRSQHIIALHTVKYGPYQARFAVRKTKHIKGPHINLKNIKQKDCHSCGFVAAMTVALYLRPGIDSKEVLQAVQPHSDYGISRPRLTRALKRIGIKATYYGDLTIGKLRKLVTKGVPVLLTVYPEDWVSDHWVAVRGFDDSRR